MKNCDKCFWCSFSWQILENPKAKTFKCKLHPHKRFNKPKIKGWFCKDFFRVEVKEFECITVTDKDGLNIKETKDDGK